METKLQLNDIEIKQLANMITANINDLCKLADTNHQDRDDLFAHYIELTQLMAEVGTIKDFKVEE